MRSTEWLTLVERKYDGLLQALRCAYMQAAGFKSDDWQEEVILDLNGHISVLSNQTHHIPLKVKNGEAIYIGAIKWFNMYEVLSVYGDTAGEMVWLEDKAIRLRNLATQWAMDQIQNALKDLRFMAEMEESDPILTREEIKI